MTWCIEVPDMPVHTKNHRGHWNARYDSHREWRQAVRLLARMADGEFPAAPVTVTLHCVQADRRRRDVDNLVVGALKPAVDGLVDAGLLADDSWRHVREVRCRLTSDPDRDVHGWWLTVTTAPLNDAEVDW